MNITSILHQIVNGNYLCRRQTMKNEEPWTSTQELWEKEKLCQELDVHFNCVASSKQPVLLWKDGDTDVSDVANLIHKRSPSCKHHLTTASCRTDPFKTWGMALSQLIEPHQPRTDEQPADPMTLVPGGTLFINDLEFLPYELQRLLYALLDQDGVIRFVGKNAHGLEIRVIASTTTDIWGKCQEGLFHISLLNQLNRLTVHDLSLSLSSLLSVTNDGHVSTAGLVP